MDPIDRIADVFALYCSQTLRGMESVQQIVDTSPTVGEAMAIIARNGCSTSCTAANLHLITVEIPRLQRCLRMMDEIKALARQVFAFNFTDEDKYFIFSQEISFSYAAKILVSSGLRLFHFSNAPTADEVMRAELTMAMQTPIFPIEPQDGLAETKRPLAIIPIPIMHHMIAKTPSPRKTILRMKFAVPTARSAVNLSCHEFMPAPKQIRQPPRHRRVTFDPL